MKNKRVTVSVLISLTVFLVSLSLWYLSYKKTADRISSLEEMERTIKEMEKEVGKKSLAGVVSSLLKDESGQINKAFVNRENPAPFFESLESLGKNMGVDVRINQALLENGNSLFKIEADGSFSSVYRYLGAIEFSVPTVSIEKMSLRFIEKGLWRVSLEFKLLN